MTQSHVGVSDWQISSLLLKIEDWASKFLRFNLGPYKICLLKKDIELSYTDVSLPLKLILRSALDLDIISLQRLTFVSFLEWMANCFHTVY